MIRRYLWSKNFWGTCSEFRSVGEPFADKILFRRDGVTTLYGNLNWSKWHEVGGEIPADARLIETVLETF